MIASTSVIAVISTFWFVIFWILGGVLFALIAFMRMAKIRKARFSCLFTLASAGAAIGAAYGGLKLADGRIEECVAGSDAFLDVLSSAIGCGIFELIGGGAMGFAALFLAGLFLMYVSRADNQSWLDSDMGLDEQEELSFDV